MVYVDFKSTLGQRFDYVWAFEINENGIVPEMTATP